MTAQLTSSADLTCEEIHAGFDGLVERLAQMAAERDLALKMAAQATKDLVRARHTVDVRDAVIKSLRIDGDGKNAEIRRLNARVHELCLVNDDQQRRLDQAQQEPKPVRSSWWSRRIGNQL